MFSVFSNTKKMTDQIQELQKCAGSNYTRLLFAGPEDEPLYILKPKVVDVLTWVNNRILFELPKHKDHLYFTSLVGVRIRIATNMLNKHVNAGRISKEIANEYHTRMTSRLRKILGEIYAEDLPFLG